MSIEAEARKLRESNLEFATWAKGYGVIQHKDETQVRVARLLGELKQRGIKGDGIAPLMLLKNLDKLASAGMWLVVHQTYASNVYLDGRELGRSDFKVCPEGHTGGALNMVPAYAAYLALNVLTGTTRAWLMGQGHCVAAIDALNLLVDNMTRAHKERYSLSDEGLTRYVRDYYLYELNKDGEQESPLGSHVNAHTAGGLAEGGYLGFAELQYVHMPLPGERLVVFLSDGAFEEQRGSDWAARWWRAEDSGFATPIMIKNGRRIDQRTTMAQQGGTDWFCEHLRLNGFEPLVFDGRDPAAFVCAIFEMEERFEKFLALADAKSLKYPVLYPYGVADTIKGAGFLGEGTNLAHNLPLMGNPHGDQSVCDKFNEGAKKLWVPPEELFTAVEAFSGHAQSGRVRERDNKLVARKVELSNQPTLKYKDVALSELSELPQSSPMEAIDHGFASIVRANPGLRPRVGNPDEMKSNRLLETLELLKFRVTEPESGIPEAINGAVVTALNEEAVAASALANKGGINLICTYEAFGTKMQGALRQEIIFSNHCEEAGRKQEWLSIPIVLTSHTWENGKNEQSHQDPSLCESLMNEAFNVSRVVFPADYNSALATISQVYKTNGQIWTLVVPKARCISEVFSEAVAQQLVKDGGIVLEEFSNKASDAELSIYVVGSYQLLEALKAARHLVQRGVAFRLVYLLEPARFRLPTSKLESLAQPNEEVVSNLFPEVAKNAILVSHTHPTFLMGVLADRLAGVKVKALGYLNKGGTLNTESMLYVNQLSWKHILKEVVATVEMLESELLAEELDCF